MNGINQTDNMLNKHYLVCPSCDALWEKPEVQTGQRVKCGRCHHVILEFKHRSWARVVPSVIGATILYFAAISFPFLSMERSGLSNEISILDTPGVLMANNMVWLGIAVFLFILVFPILRITLLFALMGANYFNLTSGTRARLIRLFQFLGPWAMAEIFIIGVIVSLVKLGDMVDLSIGIAFWAMIGFVLVLGLISVHWCRFSFWQELEKL